MICYIQISAYRLINSFTVIGTLEECSKSFDVHSMQNYKIANTKLFSEKAHWFGQDL